MSLAYLAFDCETGGLHCREHSLLTVYFAVIDKEFNKIDELDLKLKPDDGNYVVTEKAMEINKIDLEKHNMDPETLTYSEGKIKVLEFLDKNKVPGKKTSFRSLGHNVGFDIGFINQHLVEEKDWRTRVHYGSIDTKAVVDFLKDIGFLPDHLGTLISVSEYLGIPLTNAHDAKADTVACIEVYKFLVNMMKMKKDEISGITSGGIMELLEQ